MSAQNILVTGATGFIGQRLVKQLVGRGDKVTCLVRRASELTELKRLTCSIIYGDTAKNEGQIKKAVDKCAVVYHLAAATHAVHSRDLIETNTSSLRNMLDACAACSTPPTFIFVSSLAAVGPSSVSRPHDESTPLNPVSCYGRSKADCENLAVRFASQVPITIVRPPIVLGEGDRKGLQLFSMIEKWGLHFVPGFSEQKFSVLHVDDLVKAMIVLAERGSRLEEPPLLPNSDSRGIYFVSADEIVSYARLGKMIGDALGRKRTFVVRISKSSLWITAAVNEAKGRLTSVPQFINLDKYREATAGSWTCSNAKIKQELGFAFAYAFSDRLRQTVTWYREHEWLNKNSRYHIRSEARRNHGFS